MTTTTTYNPWTITKHDITEDSARHIVTERKDWDIQQIENCPERVAQLIAEEHKVIKGHDVYFLNLGEYFGYSYLVYLNGHLLRHACDYELHHSRKSKEKLRKWYDDSLETKLFTLEEIAEPLTKYSDYQNRERYIRNHLPCAEDHVSIFGIFTNDDDRTAHEQATKGLYYSRIAFAYFKDKIFVDKLEELLCVLEKVKQDTLDNYDYWKNAFRYEYANYECIYGGRYDEAIDAASGGGKLTDTQRRAAIDAKREYEQWCYEHDMP